MKHTDLTPIREMYKGYLFRSFLEIRWAVVFSEMGYGWKYEPQKFDMGNGHTYTPDFYIEDLDMWVEIKPNMLKSIPCEETLLTDSSAPKNLTVCDVTSDIVKPIKPDRYGCRSFDSIMVGDGLPVTKMRLWEIVTNHPNEQARICAEYILRMFVVSKTWGRGDWCILYDGPTERVGFDFKFQGSRPIPLGFDQCKRGKLIKSPYR